MNTNFPQVFQYGNPVNNILDDIQNHRLNNGHFSLCEESLGFFGDALRVVFIQIRDHLNNTELNPINSPELYRLFFEMAQSISALNEEFNIKFQNTISKLKKNRNSIYQTSSLYKLIINQFSEYNKKLIPEKCTKTYSELYLLINIWVYRNTFTAVFFYKKVNFRCLEMVVHTLKGGY